MSFGGIENRAVASSFVKSVDELFVPVEQPVVTGGDAAVRERTSDPRELFTLLRGAFSDPSLRSTEGAYDLVIDDYMAFIALHTSAMKEEEKDAYGELASLLKSGAPGDGEKQTLFFMNDKKTAALWIDDAAKKVTFIDVTDEGIASAPQFEEFGGDKIRATLARQDRKSQLFREYSNLSGKEIESIRQFALSAATAKIGTEQCMLKIEHFIKRSAPDLARNFHEEPDLFMKSNKALPGQGCDPLKFVSVLSQLLLKNHNVDGDMARNRRHKMKLQWQLDLLEKSLGDGERLKLWKEPLVPLEMAIRSASRTAEALFDKGLFSGDEASSVGETLKGYSAAIEKLKSVKGGATKENQVEVTRKGNPADVGQIDSTLGLFDEDPFEARETGGSSAADGVADPEYDSIDKVRREIDSYLSIPIHYTLCRYLKRLVPNLKHLLSEVEESGDNSKQRLLDSLLEPLFKTLPGGEMRLVDHYIENSGYEEYLKIIHSLYSVFPNEVVNPLYGSVDVVRRTIKRLASRDDNPSLLNKYLRFLAPNLKHLLSEVGESCRESDDISEVLLINRLLEPLFETIADGETTILQNRGLADTIHGLYSVFPNVVSSSVADVAREFEGVVETGDVEAITTYLDDILPVVVKMSRGSDGALAAELLMQLLLALPKPNRSGEASIWDTLDEEMCKRLATTIQKWFTAIPVIFKGGELSEELLYSTSGSSGDALRNLSNYVDATCNSQNRTALKGEAPRAPVAFFTFYSLLFKISQKYFGMPRGTEANNDELLLLLQNPQFSVKEGREHAMMWEVAEYLIPGFSMERLITRREDNACNNGLYARKQFNYIPLLQKLPAIATYDKYVYSRVSEEWKAKLADAHLRVASQSIFEEVESFSFEALASKNFLALVDFRKNYHSIYGESFFAIPSGVTQILNRYEEFNRRLADADIKLSDKQAPERSLAILHQEKQEFERERERSKDAKEKWKREVERTSSDKYLKLDYERLVKDEEKNIERIDRLLSVVEGTVKRLEGEVAAAKPEVDKVTREIADLRNEKQKFEEANVDRLREYYGDLKEKLLKVPFDTVYERAKLANKSDTVQENLATTLFIEEPGVDPVNEALIAATSMLYPLLAGHTLEGLSSLRYAVQYHDNSLYLCNYEFGVSEDHLFDLPDKGAVNMDWLIEKNSGGWYGYDVEKQLSKFLMNARCNAYQAVDNLTAALNFYREDDKKVDASFLETFRKMILGFGVPLHQENLEESLSALLEASRQFFGKVMRDPSYSSSTNDGPSLFQQNLGMHSWSASSSSAVPGGSSEASESDKAILALYDVIHDLFAQLQSSGTIDSARYGELLEQLEGGFIDAAVNAVYDEDNETYDLPQICKALSSLAKNALAKERPTSPFAAAFDPYRLWKVVAREQFSAHYSKRRGSGECERALSSIDFEALSEEKLSGVMNSAVAPFVKGGDHEALLAEYRWEKEEGFLLCRPLNLKMDSVTGTIDEIESRAKNIPFYITGHPLYQQAFGDREPVAHYEAKRDEDGLKKVYKLTDPKSGLSLLFEYPYYFYGTSLERRIEGGSAKLLMQYEGKGYQLLTGEILHAIEKRVPSAFVAAAKSSCWVERGAEGEGSLLVLSAMRQPILRGEIHGERLAKIFREGDENEVALSLDFFTFPFSLKGGYPLELWANISKGHAKVGIPGTRLSFDFDSDRVCRWSSDSDFTVCEEIEGELPKFLTSRDHILLQDKHGKRKALIPEGREGDLLEVDIVGSALSSPERSTLIKLVEGYLSGGQFDDAIKLLKDERLSGFDTTSEPFSDEEHRMLKGLLKEEALADPLFSTALLRVYHVLMRNDRIHRPSDIAEVEALNIKDEASMVKRCLPIAYYSLYMKNQQISGELGFSEEEIKSLSQTVDDLLERTKEGVFLWGVQQLPSEEGFLGWVAHKIANTDFVKSRILAQVESFVGSKLELSREVNRAVRGESSLLGGRRVVDATGFISSLIAEGYKWRLILGRKSAALDYRAALVRFEEYYSNPVEIDIAKEAETPYKEQPFFEKNYFALYRIAREGSEEERAHLHSILSFSNSYMDKGLKGAQSDGGALSNEIVVLTRVLEKPSSHPTIEEFKELFVERNNLLDKQSKRREKAREREEILSAASNDFYKRISALSRESSKWYGDVSDVRAGIKEWEKRLEQAKKKCDSPDDEVKAQAKREAAVAEAEIANAKRTLQDLEEIVGCVNRSEKGKRDWSVDSFRSNVKRELESIQASVKEIDDRAKEADERLRKALTNEVGFFWAILSTIVEIFRRAFRACESLFKAVDVERAREMLENAKPVELFAAPEKGTSAASVSRLLTCATRDVEFDKYIKMLAKEHFVAIGPTEEEKREWFAASYERYGKKREAYDRERAAIKALAEEAKAKPKEGRKNSASRHLIDNLDLAVPPSSPLRGERSDGERATSALDLGSVSSLLIGAFKDREKFDLPFVEENFIALYAIARDGSSAEKELLAEILIERVCDHIHSEEISIENSLPHLLLRAIDQPANYPTMEMLQGIAGEEEKKKIVKEIGIMKVGRAELDEAYFDKKELEELFDEDDRFSEKRQEAIRGKVREYNDYRGEISHCDHRFVATSTPEERERFFAKKIATASLHGGLLAEKSGDLADFYEECHRVNVDFLADKLVIGKSMAEDLLRSYSEFLQNEEKIAEKTAENISKVLTLNDKDVDFLKAEASEFKEKKAKDLLEKRASWLLSKAPLVMESLRDALVESLGTVTDAMSEEEGLLLRERTVKRGAELLAERGKIELSFAKRIVDDSYILSGNGVHLSTVDEVVKKLPLTEEEEAKLEELELDKYKELRQKLPLTRAKNLVENLELLDEISLSRAKDLIRLVNDEELLIDLYNRECMLEKLEEKVAFEELSMAMVKSNFLILAETMTTEKFRLRHLSEGRRIDEAWLREMALKNGTVEVSEELGIAEEDAEALLVMMAESLVIGTRISHLRLACRLLEQDRPENEVYESLQGLKRSYTVFASGDVDFSKLFFELYKQYNLRKDQMDVITAIADLDKEKEMVVEAPTGFGKTDAVSALAARMVAEKGKLAILCWPASLVKENASELSRAFSGAFGSRAAAMHFERNSNLHSETLKLIYEDLVACKKKKVPVNLTADALKSFILHYHTLLDELYANRESDDSEFVGELEKQADYFAKTLKLLKEESVIFIDESHATLHPKDRLIYSIGKEEKLSKDLLKTFDKVMEKFFSRKIDGVTIEELLVDREAVAISTNKEKLAEDIVELLLEDLPFADDEQKRVRRFITEGKPNPFVGKERIKAHDEAIEAVCLYKGLFGDKIFTECLEMSHNEQYGLSHKHLFGREAKQGGSGGRKRCSFAIPYSSAQTPTETDNGPSQYANHHKTMLLTYLTYFTRGLYGEGEVRESYQVYLLMKELLEQATVERARRNVGNSNFTIKETEAYKFFSKHAPEELKDKLTPKGVKNLSIEQVRALHEAMKENREVLLRFMKDVALQDINTYPETVDCTFANFLSMFDKKVMMSATPMAAASYRIDAGFYESKNTANRALEKMMLHSLDKNIVTIPGGSSEAVLRQIDGVIQDTDDCCALIDLAGLFKDVTNEEVARALNESALDEEEIEQVTYYDAKRGFVKMHRGSDAAVKDDVRVLEKRFVYFDQPRSFGSDIKLKEEGVAVVLVTPDIPFTKVAQAIGRMRKLGMDQKVRFVVPEVMLGKNKSVTKKELIAHWEAELVREEEARNTMSLQQQLDDLLQAALQKTMIGKSPAQMAKFYRKNRSFFVTKVDISAKALYGSDTVEKRGVDMLLDHIKEKKKQLYDLSGLSREEKKEIAAKLKELKHKLEKVRLKEVVRVGANNDGTMQAQQQTETQAVRQTQVELETQHENSAVPSDERDYKYKPWAEGLSLSETFAPRGSGSMSASVPFRRVEHALNKSKDSHYSAISELFDKNLLASINFWHEGQRLYSSKAKPVHSYVVQMKEGDKGTKIFTATLVEETEAHVIEKRLKEGKEGDGGAKVALFNLDKGLVTSGSRHFSREELCDPKLARLTAQIKLLSANFAYELSDAEANSLQSHPFLLGNEKNKERVFEFLQESVRSVHDVRTVENAKIRFREHLPRLLQILEKGKV